MRPTQLDLADQPQVEHNVLYRAVRLPITPDPRASAEMTCALAALRRAVVGYMRRDGDALPENTRASLDAACAEIDNIVAVLASRSDVGFS
ncbi:MAG TPA: hypothetical protein VGB82_09980 [Alphaproteobacteria bacterium]